MVGARKDVTALLNRWSQGDEAALEELLPIVYAELRAIARHKMAGERAGHTLQTTELIHEAYLRIVDQQPAPIHDRVHFLAICARLMRQVLVDHARQRGRLKRGGDQRRITLTEQGLAMDDRGFEILDLDDALSRLEAFDQRKSRVVELRFFAGLNLEETAEAIGVSSATVERDWRVARAWLFRELGGAPA